MTYFIPPVLSLHFPFSVYILLEFIKTYPNICSFLFEVVISLLFQHLKFLLHRSKDISPMTCFVLLIMSIPMYLTPSVFHFLSFYVNRVQTLPIQYITLILELPFFGLVLPSLLFSFVDAYSSTFQDTVIRLYYTILYYTIPDFSYKKRK